jgi:hypothetical protein
MQGPDRTSEPEKSRFRFLIRKGVHQNIVSSDRLILLLVSALLMFCVDKLRLRVPAATKVEKSECFKSALST